MLWSVLVEASLVTPDDSGEAEVLLLETLNDLGVPDAVTGGGFENRLAARFTIEAANLPSAVYEALRVYLRATGKAHIAVREPDIFEAVPLDVALEPIQ